MAVPSAASLVEITRAGDLSRYPPRAGSGVLLGGQCCAATLTTRFDEWGNSSISEISLLPGDVHHSMPAAWLAEYLLAGSFVSDIRLLGIYYSILPAPLLAVAAVCFLAVAAGLVYSRYQLPSGRTRILPRGL